MKVLFVSGLYPHDYIEIYRKFSLNRLQNAANVFQWGILEGLYKNKSNFNILTLPFLPSYPRKYKKVFTLDGDIVFEGEKVGKMLKYCNLYILKYFFIKKRVQKYIENWVKKHTNEEKLVILVYSFYLPFIEAANNIKNKYSNVEIVPIVTDLVDDMMILEKDCNIFRRVQINKIYKRTKKLYKCIDKFVLLSKYMVDKIPEANGRNIVIEGLAQEKPLSITPKSDNKILLYAGTLKEYSGIRDFVNAFQKVKNPNYRFIICGKGDLSDMILEATHNDPRIIYKGMVSREEVLKLQQQATILINPRKPNGHLTRYSFPSKTIECLSSGTPMMGYKLEGIPEEYFNYFYTIDDFSNDTLVDTIKHTMSLPQEELNAKARMAYKFIMDNKTAEMQVKRLLNFIR